MTDGNGDHDTPLISVILPTRDRPRLLATTLACCRHQTYPNRELIVVDDGDRAPVDPATVAALGGRLIRADPGTPLGTKLNLGADVARGALCQKIDDDDWYAPPFLAAMVSALFASWRVVCRPTVAFVAPFFLFDLARWEVRRSEARSIGGGTLLFARQDWRERPFRAVRDGEDTTFVADQTRLGATVLRVPAPTTYLAVRHEGAAGDRGHTWRRLNHGPEVAHHLLDRPLVPGGPEALLPAWALAYYRGLHRDLLARARLSSSSIA